MFLELKLEKNSKSYEPLSLNNPENRRKADSNTHTNYML